ncbi:MAG: hypothetical protein JWO31_1108 [Phycisphaerales bacterium]|nr:hypothetical protein [Phycisphaerales bacterium]
MPKPTGKLLAAVGVYVLALVPVTLVAVIFFGRLPNWAVVPVEYLLPLWPAAVVYRGGRGRG